MESVGRAARRAERLRTGPASQNVELAHKKVHNGYNSLPGAARRGAASHYCADPVCLPASADLGSTASSYQWSAGSIVAAFNTIPPVEVKTAIQYAESMI